MVLRRKKLRSANIGLLRDLQLGVLVQHKLIKFYSTRSYLTRGEIVKELFERFFSFPSSLRYGMLNNNQFDFCVSLARVDRPHGLGLLPLPQKQKKRTIIMAEAPSSVAPIAIYSTYYLLQTVYPHHRLRNPEFKIPPVSEESLHQKATMASRTGLCMRKQESTRESQTNSEARKAGRGDVVDQ